jgi:hypothetical protein
MKQILGAIVALAALSVASAHASCPLIGADLTWTQRALAGWALARDKELGIEKPYDPVIVVFEKACAWRLHPRAEAASGFTPTRTVLASGATHYVVWSAPLQGRVPLPDGSFVPPQKTSFASPLPGGGAFFAMAGPGLWGSDTLQSFAVFVHEMTHTQQQATLVRRAEQLAAEGVLAPDDTDDAIQKRYGNDRTFTAAVAEETRLLFAAAAAPTTAEAVRLARLAIQSIEKRRAAAFSGKTARLAEVEDLFLTMEGTAQWAGYRYLRNPAGGHLADKAALELMRGKRRPWSQEEGLALFLTLDRLDHGWRGEVFGSDLSYGLPLLKRALADR